MDERGQDALFWLEDEGATEAVTLLGMFRAYETRENTVIGMCMARRPHSEIRDFLLTDVFPEEDA